MFDLTILGGTIVHPRGRFLADIGIRKGKIAAIADNLSDADTRESIAAQGHFILPGCIDSHMHLWEPGFAANYDFADGTRAALAGGVTTIIDHPLTIPEVLDVDVFEQKKRIGEQTSYVDFALHGGVGEDNLENLEALWQAGCTAFKIFMCESGSKVCGLPTGKMQDAFQIIGGFGGTVLLHAENDSMLNYKYEQLQKAGRKDYMAFVDWRPPEVETEAILRALYLLEGTGARGVFLHTTVPEGVAAVKNAREKGLDVFVETCPHNLYLTTEHLKEKGPWVTFSPPVRDPQRVEKMWDYLRSGMISTMGSDHGPIEKGLKEKGENNIWESQFGIPGAETMVPLMLNAVAKGWISLEKVTAILSENPARLYGLYPRKGTIQVGSDADFTIVDLNQRYQFEAEKMYTSCGWIPYEGWDIEGKVVSTIIRGKVLMLDGEVVGEPGNGCFIRRAACNSTVRQIL